MLTWCTPKRPPTAAEPTVLELRVHGISNTPPESVLDLPTGEIERSRGDDLGSFWTPTAQARERDVLLPPGDRHHIRPDVRREAYSWGAMARLSSVPFVGALGALGRGVTRVLWTLVIPFGLANVAYWSRRPPVGQRGWKQGNGAATIRLFSLALTLLLAASTASVTLGLIGSQCFLPSQQLPADAAGADPVTASLVCSQLPSTLQLLAPMRHGQRIALFAVVPVAVVLLLWLVAHSGRVRFDERMSTSKASGPARGGTGDTSAPRSPLLATPGFWSHSLLSLTTGRLHVAAVLVLLTGVLSWEGVFGRAEACRGVSTFLTRACLVDGMGERTPHAGFVVLLVGAAVLMAWIAWRVCVVSEACADVRPGERERRVHSGWLLVVSLSAFGAAEALVWRSADPVDAGAPFTGLVATPTILVGLLFGLAFVALGWRGGLRATLWIPLLVVGGGGITADALLQELYARAWVPLALASAALVALAVAVAVAMALRRSTGAQEGWSGAGPGVFLFLSAGTAMIFSSLVVLGVSRFLNAPAATARLLIPGGYDDAVAGADRDAVRDFVLIPSREGTTIVPPRAYAEFGIATLLILAILVLVLLPPLWHMMRGVPALPNAPSASRDPEDPSARTKTSASVPAQASTADGVTLAARRVLAARRLAATLQRGEKVLGVLAFACGAALLLTLLTQTPEVLVVLADATGVPVAYDGAPTAAIVGSVVLPLPPWVLPGAVEAVATAAVGAAALLVFGSMIAGAATGAARPLGLVWDLICFLPRAAHPFGPPCYAERVVPELRGRIDAWLAGLDLPTAADRIDRVAERRVVLSAHSVGAMLAVAVLLARDEGPTTRSIGLLTYGTQLRPYFGRFFPELLGPTVLGTGPCRGADYFTDDPWRAEIERPLPAPPSPVPGALAARLGRDAKGRPAWVNLWRRTDFLGFPVDSYAPNDIDRSAEEVDRTAYLFTIAAHSGYPRAYAYHRALDTVLERIGDASPPEASGSGHRTRSARPRCDRA